MSDIVIRVEHLGKQYKLGGQQAAYSTFREALVNTARAPLRWLKGERRNENNKFWALDDVSFEVKHGEAVGIIGRNGAGKSTLLKILSRITSPTRGRVDLYGRVGSLLEVGTGFHPELTGRENIFLNGAILGMSRVEIARKFDEIIDFSEIEKFLDTPVKHYSSGMYVRLAFAVAAHLEPEILVVDEVLSVGDAQFQKKCLGKMDDVAGQGRTVLFVSHNMGAISQLCNRALVLRSGELNLDASANEAVSFYLSEIRNLENRMNFEPVNNNNIQILSMWLSGENGELINTCTHDRAYCVNIKYQIYKWRLGSYICLDVFNENDARMLWASDVKTVDEMNTDRASGVYHARITIPGMILSPGRYYFTGAVFAPGRPYAFDAREKVISIDIIDAGTLLSNFGIKYHAATIIPLQWDTTKEE
jgi:lipopolysaccharide transport system ATP-binding protein